MAPNMSSRVVLNNISGPNGRQRAHGPNRPAHQAEPAIIDAPVRRIDPEYRCHAGPGESDYGEFHRAEPNPIGGLRSQRHGVACRDGPTGNEPARRRHCSQSWSAKQRGGPPGPPGARLRSRRPKPRQSFARRVALRAGVHECQTSARHPELSNGSSFLHGDGAGTIDGLIRVGTSPAHAAGQS